MKHELIVLCCTLLFSFIGFPQSGPGGVGTTNGSSDLVLWLDANTVIGTSGSTITTWNDISGYNHHFTLGNGAVFQNGAQNGYHSFNFNGSSHYFQRVFTNNLTPTSFTIFAATNVSSSNSYKAVISNRDDPPGSATAGFILYSTPSSNGWQFWTGRAAGSWQVTTGNVSTAGNWAGQVMEYASGTNGKKLYVNSNLNATNTHAMTLNPTRPIRVGAGRNETTPNYYFNGAMAEVIMFNTVINAAQRIIIENYLSAKYDYSLVSNDIYDEDTALNGNYDHEVAGIGRVDASNIHANAQGTGIVRVSNPTNLGNNEFLIWGHNNGNLIANNSTDVPHASGTRINRVWRVSEASNTGTAVDIGTVDMVWDLSGLSSFGSCCIPQLIVDTDNDGMFSDETTITNVTSLGSDQYQFSNVTALVNNSRFTLIAFPRSLITNRRITNRVKKD
ncbi:MAG: hypothetical protein V3U92_12780 [Cellulophaga sp.]